MRVRWTLGRVERELRIDEPKRSRSRRFVALPVPVIETLRRHKTQQAAERLAATVWVPWADQDDLVFPTHVGTPLDPRNALRSFARVADRAGLDGARLHTLRHSAASALIAGGGSHQGCARAARPFNLRSHSRHLRAYGCRAAAAGSGAARRGVFVVSAPWLHLWLHRPGSCGCRLEKSLQLGVLLVGDTGFEPVTSSVSAKPGALREGCRSGKSSALTYRFVPP